MVACEDFTYPKVACLGAIMSSLRDVLAIRRKPRREATVTVVKERFRGKRGLMFEREGEKLGGI